MIQLGTDPFCIIFGKIVQKGSVPNCIVPNCIIFNFAGENES